MFLDIWGKASPAVEGQSHHPLIFHALDVAAVAERLLRVYPSLVVDMATLCGVSEASVAQLLVRLAALHDIGKVVIGFQAKQPGVYPASYPAPPDPAPLGDHVLSGFHLLTDRRFAPHMAPFIARYEAADWAPLLIAVSAHHGRPLDPARRAPALQPCERAAAAAHAEAVLTVSPGAAFEGEMDEQRARRVAMRLAGLVNLADWIGSHQASFPYTAPMDVETYWTRFARPRAAAAMARAGLSPAPVAASFGLEAFAHIETPSRLQAWARDVALPAHGPVLALLEDATGAGKTEAALLLAHRLMATGRGKGLYIALPTMATANAMYARLGAVYRALFAADAAPSLALAHGGAALHAGFRDSIVDIGAPEPAYSAGDEETASAACAAWIADDRRRAFFAQVGVGTVDQAFLGVLPSRFAALRLLGLSGSILVVDEAHAYDAYAGEELAALLRFHAAHGGSAIVMSATLPAVTKQALVQAFRQGRGALGRAPARAWPAAYPLATLVDAAEIVETPVETRADRRVRIDVERLSDEEAALARICAAARAGACVAWVRNTVDDCLDAAARLTAMGIPPLIHHARFAMADRQANEARVVAMFGRESRADARAGRVLVATQVIEQSIDVDFDLMVTDLAPMDLLLQRAGRLWRHGRGLRVLETPRLLVLAPDPEGHVDGAWLTRLSPLGGRVYPDHALLWRTAQTLFAAGAVEAPRDMRPLVEAVYGPEALEDAPEALQKRRLRADGEARAAAGLARQNVLDFQDPYAWSAGWSADAVTPTRLGEARTVLWLARWRNGRLEPWAADAPGSGAVAGLAWALSEASVAAWRVAGRGDLAAPVEAEARRLEALMPGRGERYLVFPLEPGEDGVWRGRGRRGDGEAVIVAYDRVRGVMWA